MKNKSATLSSGEISYRQSQVLNTGRGSDALMWPSTIAKVDYTRVGPSKSAQRVQVSYKAPLSDQVNLIKVSQL